MDKMEHYEAEMLMDNMNYADKEEWERTRLLMYSALSPYLKNKSMKPEELLPLSTDDAIKEQYEEHKPTKNEYDEMRQMTMEFANRLKEKEGQK